MGGLHSRFGPSWRIQKSVSAAEIPTPDRSARSLFATKQDAEACNSRDLVTPLE